MSNTSDYLIDLVWMTIGGGFIGLSIAIVIHLWGWGWSDIWIGLGIIYADVFYILVGNKN